jgi:Protein of unknown function (DUF1236)
MKRKTSTIATVATFLVALSFTAAQAGPQTDPMGPGGGDKGGAMQPSSPGGALDQPRSTPGQSDLPGTEQGNAGPKGSPAGSPPLAGDAAKEPKGNAGAEAEKSTDSKANRPEDDKAGRAAEGKSDTKDGMSEDKSRTTADDRDDQKAKNEGKSARLESKDVTKVKTYFSQNKPNAKRIDRDEVSVSIGIALPTAIALYDLPSGVIVVTGACPIKYFVWDDDIVLVDSCTREVVEIIADVA